METAEKMKPILVAECKAVMTKPLQDWLDEEGLAELNSWDVEGRVIVEQIISRSPYRFQYYFKKKPAYCG